MFTMTLPVGRPVDYAEAIGLPARPFAGWEKLSAREREILYWVAEGKTDKEIGTTCGISHRTVQRHVQVVLQKMAMNTRTAAAAVVWRARLGGWRDVF